MGRSARRLGGDRRKVKPLTVEEILAMPATVDVPWAGRAWGFGRSKSYDLAAAGEFPCLVLQYGGEKRVARAAIIEALGIKAPAVDGRPAA